MALFELRTLGTLDLHASDGRVVHSLLAQPKRLALLTYLRAANPGGMHRRDVLLALFWPESDREHARTSLRSGLHVLRRSLGERAVLTEGDDGVGIDPDAVWCDAVAFEEAIAAERHADALVLYRGDLLAGFFVREAPDFERWLERERARLRQLAAKAAGQLAEQRAAARDLPGAVSAARRAVELAEFDEPALRRLLEMLARTGDRAAALEAYDGFTRKLAAEYDAEPSGPTRMLVERLRSGSITSAEIPASGERESVTSEDGAGASPPHSRVGASDPRGSTFNWTRTSAVRAAIFALLALGAIGTTGMLLNAHERRRHPDDAVPLERRIAVLPFRNLSVAAADEFLADGLHDAVITQLSRVAELQVTSRQSVRAFRNTDKSIHQIGQELGVGTVVDASVQRVGDTVRVAVEVIDARRDNHVSAGHYERPATAVFSLENDVALGVAELLEARIPRAERAVLSQPPTRNARAYTFYLKGREYLLRHQGPARGLDPLGRTEVAAAEGLFTRAIAADSSFALAHAALSAAHAEMYFLYYDRSPARRESILVEATAALRLQPDLPEGHLAMGYYWYVGHQDWARALPEFEIARRGMPSDRQAQLFIANVYRRQGRWSEALAGHERAFQLAPLESDKALNLARTYQAMRRYADAARTLDYAIAIEPTNYGFVLERGRLFVEWQGALDSLEAALGRIPADVDLGARIVIDRMELALFRRQPLEAVAALKAARPGLLEKSNVLDGSWVLFRSGQAHDMLGDAANARRDYDAARVMLERAIETVDKAGDDDESFDLHANLSLVYAALGRKQEAVAESQHMRQILPESKDAWAGFGRMKDAAAVFARVGDYDAAFAALERQLTTPAGVSVQILKLDPRWDPLRRDPRFQRLLARHEPGA